ncbi:MAG: phage major capsid protein [Tannerella sp.]|jgi:HK97 family phage major capsid protein|nr:phage major capsid protein [Tannerella sp.]
MRKKKEVQRELQQALDNVRALKNDPEKQEEYRSALDTVQSLTDELNGIVIAEAAERALAENTVDQETEQAARRFSIVKFIRELGTNGILTGVEAEMSQLAFEEATRSGIKLQGSAAIPAIVLNRAFPGMTATGTPADGGMTIATVLQYQEELRKRLVLAKAGAKYISGLVGNIDLIEGAAITATWEGENDKTGDKKKQFSKRSMMPKRLALNVPISKQLIAQSSWDVERMIYEDILAAHAEALEDAAINGSGTGEPLGILNTTGIGSVSLGANGDAPTFKSMVDLETAIALKNADVASMAYITTTKARGALKTTLKANNVPGYIWERDEINGYHALASNIVPANLTKGSGTDLSAALFGNFSDLIIAQWGGFDVITDPYSLKKEGAIEITMNAYHDIFLRRIQSFAAVKDIVA